MMFKVYIEIHDPPNLNLYTNTSTFAQRSGHFLWKKDLARVILLFFLFCYSLRTYNSPTIVITFKWALLVHWISPLCSENSNLTHLDYRPICESGVLADIWSLLSKLQLNHNLTIHNPKLGFTKKWLCTPPQTQYPQYLPCYLPNFDETLKIGSWEHH